MWCNVAFVCGAVFSRFFIVKLHIGVLVSVLKAWYMYLYHSSFFSWAHLLSSVAFAPRGGGPSGAAGADPGALFRPEFSAVWCFGGVPGVCFVRFSMGKMHIGVLGFVCGVILHVSAALISIGFLKVNCTLPFLPCLRRLDRCTCNTVLALLGFVFYHRLSLIFFGGAQVAH